MLVFEFFIKPTISQKISEKYLIVYNFSSQKTVNVNFSTKTLKLSHNQNKTCRNLRYKIQKLKSLRSNL